MVTISVARAGTAEALTADFVCDGIDDQIEINAAIEAAGQAGGGTVHLAPGQYWTSRPVVSFHDNVALEGAADRTSVISPSADWAWTLGPEGARIIGIVSFVGVDGYAARNLVIEAGHLPERPDPPWNSFNGIQAIPSGPLGTGTICTDGVFENNVVRMPQGHTYSLWGQGVDGLEIIGNLVEGGATLELAHGSQEGIEIAGGRNVLIQGNIVRGIGNGAIVVGGLANDQPDADVENIVIIDNQVSYSRVGMWIGTTWSAQNGTGDARNIRIEDNVFTEMFETGFQIRNWTGNTSDPPEVAEIVFRGNRIEMLYAPSAGHNPSAIWLFNATQAGETIHRDILIERNDITVAGVDAVPPRQWLSQNASPLVAIQFFSNVSFRDNDIDLVATSANSRGVLVYDSTDIAVVGNHLRGGGVYPIEFYNTSNFTIDGNDISQWNDAVFAGIIAGLASNYTITNNVLHDTAGGVRPFILNIYQSDPALSLAGNLRVSDQDASLAGSVIQHLTLAGAAVIGIGNGLNNVITGNAGANHLHGAGGIDTLIGLGGNDIYYTDVAATQVIEAIGGGFDRLYSSVSYVLGAGSEVELLSTNNAAGTGAINLTGNALGQMLVGNEGVNVLHGGGGADVLIGYGGNDIYFTDVAATQPVEAMGGGNDQLYTSVSYVLGSGEIELLSTNNAAGTGAINLTGNNFNQTLLGNNGANQLHGGGGADTLMGLGGNDIYYTDVAATQVVETAGGGNDQLYTSVSYVLGSGSEVELLSTSNAAGTAALNLTGNGSGQVLLGNAGANVLDGKGGADTLLGLGGADTFAFSSALGGGNVDVIGDFSAADDTISLDDAIFTALGLGALSANAFVIGSAALDADDRIIYNSSNGALFYDADGNGAGAAVQFASLGTGLAMTASEFAVI